jgi:RNA polymerase sigma-70 factor (ECF subfamily)
MEMGNFATYATCDGGVGGRAGSVDDVFRTMAEDHQAALRQLAFHYSRNEADARDVVQDAFERALRKRPVVQSRRELRFWLTVVVRNLCITQWRAPARRTTSIDLGAIPAPDLPEDQFPWQTVKLADVEGMLQRLNGTTRDAFALHMKGTAVGGIAELLGISKAQVSVRLCRARRRLRKLLLESMAQ